jgi:multiple sugar transport system permease protein
MPRRLQELPTYAVLTIGGLLSALPLIWMLASAFKPGASILTDPLSFRPGDFTLDNFRALFADQPVGRGFANTGIMLVVKGTLTMVFCPLAGFAFAKYRFPGRDLLFGLVLLTLMLPTLVLIVPLLLEMQQLGWVDTYQALILPGSIDAFSIFWMRQVIAAIPDELLDAGRIDGCTPFQLFRFIVVPVIRPGLAALAVLTFLNIYNDFVWPVVAAGGGDHQTLQVLLSSLARNTSINQLGSNGRNVWGELLAAASIATLPVLLAFIALQRQFLRGLLAGSVKG